jgi:hypothetical protein
MGSRLGDTILYAEVCSNAHESAYLCPPCRRLLRSEIELSKNPFHTICRLVFLSPSRRCREWLNSYCGSLSFSLPVNLRNILIEADRRALTAMRRIGDE